MRAINYVKENYLLLLILLLAAALRLYHLDFQSIWIDEIHTMIEANPDMSMKEFDEIIMFREGIPHFYFLAVRLFFEIFGYSTFTARFFSAVVGIVSVYVIYLLGKELYNKRAGLVAASLLAVNQFHIYYSQEARSYALLLLFTILAFYRLLLFVKNPTWRTAVFFGLCSGLIPHAHPIGLTVILAQYLVVLFVLVKTVPAQRKQFFVMSFFSGIIALLVFYPVYRIVSKVSDITSFWVTMPTPDVFTQLISEFLGKSELTFFIFSALFLFYVISLFKQTSDGKSWKDLEKSRLITSFLVFTSWIGIAFLIPLIRSYLQIPMIVSRYFINVLPVILLMVAIGAALIRSGLVRTVVISSLLLLSIVDLLVVKNYYNTVTKSQFREVTELVIKKNAMQDKVISAYGWLLSYYLDKGKSVKETIEMPLESYINAMRNQSIPMESFWYVDGSLRPYNLSPEDQKFLEDNFTMTASVAKHDAWARHYVSKVPPVFDNAVDLRSFTPSNFDSLGNLLIFESGTVVSPWLRLQQGKYTLVLLGNSVPNPPINGENAHIKVFVNEKEVGATFLSEKDGTPENTYPFELPTNTKTRIKLVFDNDFSNDKTDRNVIIRAIKVVKR